MPSASYCGCSVIYRIHIRRGNRFNAGVPLRLDYLSCVLTIASTIMVGRKLWLGWIVAAVNSLLICVIGLQTSQTGFIPANLFCLALYAYNLARWRNA